MQQFFVLFLYHNGFTSRHRRSLTGNPETRRGRAGASEDKIFFVRKQN
jgi:hypothetical protein